MPRASLKRTYPDAPAEPAIDLGPVSCGHIAEMWLPRCPDCGGMLLWVEASHGAGARECAECEAVFLLELN